MLCGATNSLCPNSETPPSRSSRCSRIIYVTNEDVWRKRFIRCCALFFLLRHQGERRHERTIVSLSHFSCIIFFRANGGLATYSYIILWQKPRECNLRLKNARQLMVHPVHFMTTTSFEIQPPIGLAPNMAEE